GGQFFGWLVGRVRCGRDDRRTGRGHGAVARPALLWHGRAGQWRSDLAEPLRYLAALAARGNGKAGRAGRAAALAPPALTGKGVPPCRSSRNCSVVAPPLPSRKATRCWARKAIMATSSRPSR